MCKHPNPMNQIEALIAIVSFFSVLVIVVTVIFVRAMRDERLENQEYRIKLDVIIENLIDIVRTHKYGDDEED